MAQKIMVALTLVVIATTAARVGHYAHQISRSDPYLGSAPASVTAGYDPAAPENCPLPVARNRAAGRLGDPFQGTEPSRESRNWS